MYSGNKKSCGCRKYIKNINNTDNFRQCCDCEEVKELISDNFRKAEKNEYEYRCKECSKKFDKTGLQRLRCILHSAKKINNKRKMSFDIDLDFLKEYLKEGTACYYCEDDTVLLGLDRKNHGLGYLKSNVVPCCYTCNVCKMDIFTSDEMKKIIGPAIKKTKELRKL